MRSTSDNHGDYMDDQEYWGYDGESENKYQRRHCVFCNKVIGKDEHIRFVFSYGQKYLAAHYDCFSEKCRDNGASEEGIEELLNCLDIEIEY